MTKRAWLTAFTLMIVAASVGRAQFRAQTANVEPLVESTGVHAGTAIRAALQVRLPERLHVQSNKPRDPSLIPTVLNIEPPAGVQVGEIVFPPSTDLEQVGQSQPLAVFEREFAIGVRFDVVADQSEGTLEVPGRLTYQACDENLCYPPATANVSWILKVVAAGVPVVAGHREIFEKIKFGTGEAPPVRSEPPIPFSSGTEGAARNAADLDAFTVLATAGGYLPTKDFLRFVHDAERGVKQRGLFEGRGPLAILLIVFVGGLALNLTPCVLPMVPINLAIIGAGAQAGSRRRGFLLGALYGAAMAIVYGVLGLIVILTAGTFGTINSSAWFNLAIAVVFAVLALAMFDVITIDFTRFSNRVNVGAKSGTLVLAFGMGAIAALLAGACVAPVVIQVVLFASDLYAKGTPSALALPFLLGIGMAVPWPIAGAGIAALPKPGRWMVRVKQAFGVLILATGAYYGYQAYTLFANRWVDASAVASSVQEKIKAGWHSSLAEGLTEASRTQQPVLIDLWATWCKNCLTMDQTTLEDPEVTATLAGYVKIKFQAEQPDAEPAKSVMKRFDAVGLPTYVILRRRTSSPPSNPAP
jgi:thiol:disulfide interchange protein